MHIQAAVQSAQAVPVAVHYNHAWVVWMLYLVGAALHVILQVDDIARKNGWQRWPVVKAIGAAVAYRNFLSAMIFGLIWHYPLLISGALKLFGVNVGPDEAEVLAIPMNNFVAGIYGLGLDVILGYLPGLKSWLPDVGATWNGVDRRGKTPGPQGQQVH